MSPIHWCLSYGSPGSLNCPLLMEKTQLSLKLESSEKKIILNRVPFIFSSISWSTSRECSCISVSFPCIFESFRKFIFVTPSTFGGTVISNPSRFSSHSGRIRSVRSDQTPLLAFRIVLVNIPTLPLLVSQQWRTSRWSTPIVLLEYLGPETRRYLLLQLNISSCFSLIDGYQHPVASIGIVVIVYPFRW